LRQEASPGGKSPVSSVPFGGRESSVPSGSSYIGKGSE
jgi:hypothetical protein